MKTLCSIFLLSIFFSFQAYSQVSITYPTDRQSFSYSGADTVHNKKELKQINLMPVPNQKAGTILWESIGGLTGGCFVSYFSAAIVSRIFDESRSSDPIVIVSMFVGYDLGAAAAITLIGNNKQIKGNFGSAIFGTLAGNAASLLIARMVPNKESNESYFPAIVVITLVVPPVIGGMIGYSMSRHWDKNYLKTMENSSSLEKQQSIYSNTFADRCSIDGLYLSVGQNPYKIIPEPMAYMNLLSLRF